MEEENEEEWRVQTRITNYQINFVSKGYSS